jgi:arylmalonate decarboxylase
MTERPPAPLLGVIVPPADGAVPPELPQLYGAAIRFASEGLALPQMSRSGYDAVIDRVAQSSRRLAAGGAQAIALMGTSLSFYRGSAFNDALTRTMREATGLPATTMSHAIVEALHAVGARRLAVATAYTDEVNDRLTAFLQEKGFEVLGLDALQLLTVAQVHSVIDRDLLELGERAVARAPGADSLLISCGGLRTLGVTIPLEARLRIPVVSSAVAGAWAAVRLLGHDGSAPGHGRLLEVVA